MVAFRRTETPPGPALCATTKGSPHKLQINAFDVRLDVEPSGVFVRPRADERHDDPHLTFHWKPKRGSTNNTPHLTRRGQPRVWLPEFPHDGLLDLLAKFQFLMFKRFLAGLRLVDVVGASERGWFFCPAPPSLAEQSIRETKPGQLVWDIAPMVPLVIDHALVSAEPAAHFLDRGPGGRYAVTSAMRWKDGALVDMAMVGWFVHGVWDPFVDGDPQQVGPHGWYWLPSHSLIRKSDFTRLLGPNARKRLREARRLVTEFFGPALSNANVELDAIEADITHRLERHRR